MHLYLPFLRAITTSLLIFTTATSTSTTDLKKEEAPIVSFSPSSSALSHHPETQTLAGKLLHAHSLIEKILSELEERWQVQKYPNFLRSVAMTHTSWEVLKLKFQHRIFSANSNPHPEHVEGVDRPHIKDFVISFMGSSVTAGHDVFFNESFSEITGRLMSPVFESLGIKLISRNAAMGNNPCMPYDVCVKTFAGSDVDIVHWEQSYNCFISDDEKRTKSIFEQFVRQSVILPREPVVVFSDSATPNWKEKDCSKEKPEYELTSEDNKLLDALKTDPIRIASMLNKNELSKWGALIDLLKRYKTAGIQLFHHSGYAKYKCQGPYVKDWGKGVASWHPSKLGHELRAAHHSYFWLQILKDAIKEMEMNMKESPELLLTEFKKEVEKHVDSEHKYIPEEPIYESMVSNSIQCLTNFEPRAEEGLDITSRVVHGLARRTGDPEVDKKEKGWKSAVFEEFLNGDILKKHRTAGYRDFKYMLYGNKDDGPLSIHVTANDAGTAFMCQVPGSWGKYPEQFQSFWMTDTKVFRNHAEGIDLKSFDFENAKASSIEMKFTHSRPTDTQEICAYFNEKLPKGEHVITIVPSDEKSIILSILLIP